MRASQLLIDHQSLFHTLPGTTPDTRPDTLPILDLACGGGRNGLYLAKQGLSVIFADRNGDNLADISAQPHINPAQCWQVDLETGEPVLPADSYQAILCFRYLHRPLFSQIKKAVCSGGIVMYETFTVDNRQFGRPHRKAFLLQKNELRETFKDWKCLHYFEGVKSEPGRAIAQIICRKP